MLCPYCHHHHHLLLRYYRRRRSELQAPPSMRPRSVCRTSQRTRPLSRLSPALFSALPTNSPHERDIILVRPGAMTARAIGTSRKSPRPDAVRTLGPDNVRRGHKFKSYHRRRGEKSVRAFGPLPRDNRSHSSPLHSRLPSPISAARRRAGFSPAASSRNFAAKSSLETEVPFRKVATFASPARAHV